jgi:hypothetical protein
MKRFDCLRCSLVIVLGLTLVVVESSNISTKQTLDNLNSIVVDDTDDAANEGGSVPLDDDVVLIEENPDFVERQIDVDDNDSGGTGRDDDSESDDDDGGDTDKFAAKSKMNEALRKTKLQSRNAVKLLKRNRVKITVALTLFAFRKEILPLVIFLGRSQLPKSNTTAILKLILFVHFMRQLQTGKISSPTLKWLSAVGDSNPMLGSLLSKHNPASLPPIQQHYTFERYVPNMIAISFSLHLYKDSLALTNFDPTQA